GRIQNRYGKEECDGKLTGGRLELPLRTRWSGRSPWTRSEGTSLCGKRRNLGPRTGATGKHAFLFAGLAFDALTGFEDDKATEGCGRLGTALARVLRLPITTFSA